MFPDEAGTPRAATTPSDRSNSDYFSRIGGPFLRINVHISLLPIPHNRYLPAYRCLPPDASIQFFLSSAGT